MEKGRIPSPRPTPAGSMREPGVRRPQPPYAIKPTVGAQRQLELGGTPSAADVAPPRGPQTSHSLRDRLQALTLRRLNLKTIAVALMVVGALITLVPFGIVGYGMWQESQLTQQWAQSARQVALAPDAGNLVGLPGTPGLDRSRILPPFATPQPAESPHPSIPALFAIRVPKIGYYAAVRQGVSVNILAYGPGHYPTTALPGQPGLIGIAAHNTFWIPFGQLGQGDTVVLETQTAKFTYRITGTKIVNPDDTSVLAATPDSRLVLTTCWPLWAGNLAPQRLALFAQPV